MPAGRPHGPNDPSLMSSLETAVRRVRRPGPVELTWNWRWELGILAVLAVTAGLITGAFGLLGLSVATVGLAAGAAALLCWPPARQWCVARAWCLITPHRVRAGCVNAWVQNRSGRLPFILGTTPTDYGEQVRLWLRAGLTAADLQAARDVLVAPARWATEVRVVPSASRAHLVTLEVIRTRHSERVRPTPEAWTSARRVAGDGVGGTEERDTPRWAGEPDAPSLSLP